MELDRKIKLFFVTYGRLLLYIIGAIAIFILFLRGLNDYAVQEYKKNEISTVEVITKEKKEEEEYISEFINYCNAKKIQEAYNMLTDECRNERYNTIEKFKSQYINNLFNIEICEFKIEKQNDIYNVYLTEDMLITGKTEGTKQTKLKVDKAKKISINDQK